MTNPKKPSVLKYDLIKAKFNAEKIMYGRLLLLKKGLLYTRDVGLGPHLKLTEEDH